MLLEFNSIASVPQKALSGVTSLKYLQLSSNRLTEFPDLSEVAGTLTTLLLDKNQIKNVKSEYINVLTKLEILGLTENKILSLPDLSGVATKLSELHLYWNQLEKFPHAYKRAKSLTMVGVNRNNLEDIKANHFQLIANKKFSHINMVGNSLKSLPVLCEFGPEFSMNLDQIPFVCDKKMAWILTDGVDVTFGSCEEPDHLRGRPLNSLSYADLGIHPGIFILFARISFPLNNVFEYLVLG